MQRSRSIRWRLRSTEMTRLRIWMIIMSASVRDGYEYTGGAHGTPFRQYFVFDRETGARLSLSDVVENPVEELQAKVGAAFRELAEKTNFAFESPGGSGTYGWQTASATNRRFI